MAPPLINGIAYTWAQIKVSIGGVEVVGITQVTYDDEQEMQDNYGQGNYPVSRATGKITYTGSITLHMTEVEALQAASPTGRIQDLKEFPVFVSYLPEGGTLVRHKLEFCRFTKNSRDVSQGDMEIGVELPLIIGNINWRA